MLALWASGLRQWPCGSLRAETPKPAEAPVASAALATDAPSKAPAPENEPPPAPDTRENPLAVAASAPPLRRQRRSSRSARPSATSWSASAARRRSSCRLNCGKYDPPPAGCGDQVRAALECARDARDLTCANVAPETCAKKFREIASCAAGEAAPVEKAPAGLPEGWEQVRDSANGFSVAMPIGSVVKAGAEGPVRTVTVADTVYTVSVLPAQAISRAKSPSYTF